MNKNGFSVLIVGALMLFTSFFIYQGQKGFISASTVIQGSIERIESRSTTDGKEYSAIVSYNDLEGQPRTIKVDGASTLKYAKSGESVALRFDNHDIDHVVIDSFWQLWGTVLMIGFVSLVILLAGMWMLLKHWKR